MRKRTTLLSAALALALAGCNSEPEPNQHNADGAEQEVAEQEVAEQDFAEQPSGILDGNIYLDCRYTDNELVSYQIDGDIFTAYASGNNSYMPGIRIIGWNGSNWDNYTWKPLGGFTKSYRESEGKFFIGYYGSVQNERDGVFLDRIEIDLYTGEMSQDTRHIADCTSGVSWVA